MRLAATLVLSLACGGSQPQEPASDPPATEPEETAPATPAEPDAVERPEPEPEGPARELSLACGRATGQLSGWELVPAGTNQCINPGYPMDIDATGIAGGYSEHELTRGACRLVVVAGEQVLDDERERWADAPRTPEGTALAVTVRGEHCDEEAATVERELVESLTVRPLMGGREVRFDISSAGHGIAGELPEGYWVASLGGIADQWETAYELRGPGEATASIYTRWYFEEEDGPQRGGSGFRAALLPRRPRWTTAPEPWHEWRDEELACQRAEIAPEARLRVGLYLCGSRRERRALLDALGQLHFTAAATAEDEAPQPSE